MPKEKAQEQENLPALENLPENVSDAIDPGQLEGLS
jgi:hypothetical protein